MDAWEHIREAERLLATDPAVAQVHATLAVAMGLAIEFDPTSTPDRATPPAPVRPLRSTP